MKAFGSLPDGYREICSVDLKKDKKAAELAVKEAKKAEKSEQK